MCLSQADQVKSTCTKEKEASVQFLYPQQFTYSQLRAESVMKLPLCLEITSSFRFITTRSNLVVPIPAAQSCVETAVTSQIQDRSIEKCTAGECEIAFPLG